MLHFFFLVEFRRFGVKEGQEARPLRRKKLTNKWYTYARYDRGIPFFGENGF